MKPPCVRDSAEPITRLLYASRVVSEGLAEREAELESIFQAAERNNPGLRVTGALLFHDSWFVQALEGPEDAVHGLFRTICLDPRHRGVVLLSDGAVEVRAFALWSMCARHLSHLDARMLAQLDRRKAFDPRDCPEPILLQLLCAVGEAQTAAA